MKFRVQGIDAMRRRIAKANETLSEQVETAMKAEGKVLLEEARALVPIDTGELRDSGHVVTAIEGKTATAAVVFDAPHARIVHEDLEIAHPAGEPKFLEKALNAAAPSLHRRIGKRIVLKRIVLKG